MSTITNRVDVNNLLAQMRDMKSQAMGHAEIQPRSGVEGALKVGATGKVEAGGRVPDFSEMFGNAINSVNETQQNSAALAKAYETGAEGVTLSQVMVASQKAAVSFQAVTQVRNKLVEAYKDVMSMPI